MNALADNIKTAGGQADAFSVAEYSADEITAAFSSIHARYPSPEYAIAVAVFNVGHGVWKPFLQVTPEDVRESCEINVEAAFAFSRAAILAFQNRDAVHLPSGAKGTLIFTGATASLRGNVTTGLFASGKFALRALSQSLAKEFSKEDIHVGPLHSRVLISSHPQVIHARCCHSILCFIY